jgi:hypothetical protein
MVAAGAAWLAAGTAYAQPAQPATPMSLPVLVDGAKTPTQIPDNVAYRHYLKAIAAHPVPTTYEQGRQAAQLLSLGLLPNDEKVLIATLAPLRTQLDLIESTRAGIQQGPNAGAQFADLNDQEDALVATTLQSLRTSLTVAGMYRVDQYVKTHVKAHIKIYGTAGMAH